MNDDSQFFGEISAQSMVDIVQFYVQSNRTIELILSEIDRQGFIYIKNARVVHAKTKDSSGIDAFYEIMSWKNGEFKANENIYSDIETIHKGWTDLILEFYVLVDEKKLSNSRASKPIILAKLDRGSRPDRESKHEINHSKIENDAEWDFSDLNSELNLTPAVVHVEKEKYGNSAKEYREKIRPILDLDGLIAVSIVDLTSGMSLIEECKNKDINLEIYSAYIVEVVKANKKFLNKLKISEQIEDIIINLDKKYHIITFITSKDDIFIYVILDKEMSNLAISRLTLSEVEMDWD